MCTVKIFPHGSHHYYSKEKLILHIQRQNQRDTKHANNRVPIFLFFFLVNKEIIIDEKELMNIPYLLLQRQEHHCIGMKGMAPFTYFERAHLFILWFHFEYWNNPFSNWPWNMLCFFIHIYNDRPVISVFIKFVYISNDKDIVLL